MWIKDLGRAYIAFVLFLCFISQPTQAHLHADRALTCRYLRLIEGKKLTEEIVISKQICDFDP